MASIAINGPGRIGRAALKVREQADGADVVAVNDLVPPDNLDPDGTEEDPAMGEVLGDAGHLIGRDGLIPFPDAPHDRVSQVGRSPLSAPTLRH